ncbi:MAG TPA: ATP-binding protein, partial [Polyangiaceae bacterium]
MDITSDPETVGMAFEAVRLLAAGVALTFAGYLVYNSTRLATPGIRGIMLLDAIAGAIAGTIFWLAKTQRVRPTRFEVLTSALALSVALNVAISVPILREAGDLQFMMVVAMGGAASVLSKRWLVVILAGPAALGLFSATLACSHREIVYFIASQAGASLVAAVIFVGRVRSQRRLLRFRIRDARTNGELTKALELAEREFREHQATELQRLELFEQLRQAQKMEALGTLAGGVAHDINNVIGAITAIASVTVDTIPVGGPGRKELQEILVAARRSTTLTRNLVRFARQDQPRNAPFAPDEDVVVGIEALLRRTLSKQIELKTDCGCRGWVVMGDAGLVGHALMNLCLNSAEASSEHGVILIQTRVVGLDADEAQQLGVKPGDYVEISVRDQGHGMSQEVLRRAFEPFFSTKDGQRRSGLGLPMVYATIQQHQGGLKVQSEPEKGTT